MSKNVKFLKDVAIEGNLQLSGNLEIGDLEASNIAAGAGLTPGASGEILTGNYNKITTESAVTVGAGNGENERKNIFTVNKAVAGTQENGYYSEPKEASDAITLGYFLANSSGGAAFEQDVIVGKQFGKYAAGSIVEGSEGKDMEWLIKDAFMLNTEDIIPLFPEEAEGNTDRSTLITMPYLTLSTSSGPNDFFDAREGYSFNATIRFNPGKYPFGPDQTGVEIVPNTATLDSTSGFDSYEMESNNGSLVFENNVATFSHSGPLSGMEGKIYLSYYIEVQHTEAQNYAESKRGSTTTKKIDERNISLSNTVCVGESIFPIYYGSTSYSDSVWADILVSVDTIFKKSLPSGEIVTIDSSNSYPFVAIPTSSLGAEDPIIEVLSDSGGSIGVAQWPKHDIGYFSNGCSYGTDYTAFICPQQNDTTAKYKITF